MPLEHHYHILDHVETPSALQAQFVTTHPARQFNTPFQISATRPAYAVYTAQIPVVSTLAGGQTKTVILEGSDSDTGPWSPMAQAQMTLNQTLGLTVTLTTEPQGIITTLVPAGHWIRLRQTGPGTPISVIAATETTL